MTDKEKQYHSILIQICIDRDLTRLATYLKEFNVIKEVIVPPKIKYNITALPEAVCDGCEG